MTPDPEGSQSLWRLYNATHYPVEAVCMACGRQIRCDGWLLGEWHHVEPETSHFSYTDHLNSPP